MLNWLVRHLVLEHVLSDSHCITRRKEYCAYFPCMSTFPMNEKESRISESIRENNVNRVHSYPLHILVPCHNQFLAATRLA